MNILLISTMDTGGAGQACVRLHLGLRKQGMDSRLLLLEKNNSEIPGSYSLYGSRKLYSQIKDAQQKIFGSRQYKLRGFPQTSELFTFPYSSHRITRHSLVQWADVINLHWVSRFIDYPSFFKEVNKPVAWTLHDMNAFSGGYHYKTNFPASAYQKILARNISVKKKALRKFRDLKVVTLCHWMDDISSNSEVFHPYPHHLIPNGLDTSIFRPYDPAFAREVFGLPANRKIILFVAHDTTDERKGFRFLQEALEKHLPDDIVLAVLGGKAGQLQLAQRTIALGKIQDERLMALAYSAADLFVIPSIEDNLPNTVVESICCGTPVTGFRIGGIPDMVKPGMNGFLADDIEAAALAAEIKKALEFSFDKNKIREDAVARFDESVQARRYIELFHQMV